MIPYRVKFQARGDVVVAANSEDEAVEMADIAVQRMNNMNIMRIDEIEWIGVEGITGQ